MMLLTAEIKRIKTFTLTVTALFCIFCGFAHAEKMSYSLQEAIYLFEMKGETEDAIHILKKVIEQGDNEDKEHANFYLGKIQELSGNYNAANFYYKQSLINTKETSKAYWLAEREAETSKSNESLLQKKLYLKSPIKKIFRSTSTYLQLQNGTLQKINGDTLYSLNLSFPENIDILSISDQGIWYQYIDRDSLYYQSLVNINQQNSFPIGKTKSLYTSGENTLAQGEHVLTLLNKKNIKAQISEKYNDCEIEGFYATSGHFILNCPDNSLHFISSEDASESYTITQFEAIQKILIDKNDILLLAGNNLFCYQPKISSAPRWKVSFSNTEIVTAFEKRIVVLEASGRITLLSKETGAIKSILRSEASNIQILAQGTLGLFTNEGALTVVDTILRPIWHFNFAKPIIEDVIHTESSIFLIFNSTYLQSIAPHYYGKTPLLSEKLERRAALLAEEADWVNLPIVLDSIFKLEPGNAEAWLFKALYLENTKGDEKDKQKAWSEAVRYSASNPRAAPLILSRYSKAINAKFVNLLNISPKTKYPQIFGNKKNLYVVDPAAERLLCLNTDNGDLRWYRNLPKMENAPIMDQKENTFALVSGFNLYLFDLSKEVPPTQIQLPGKAFNIQISDSATYVSTWNGFLLKIMQSDGRLAWSRKIFSIPLLFTKKDNELHLASLEGDVIHLWDGSGQIKGNGSKLQNGITLLAQSDSILAIATSNNKIYLYNSFHSEKEPVQILMGNSITSLQSVTYKDKSYFIIGLSDQSIHFYSAQGAPLWVYQGQNTIFNAPFIHDDHAWLDQGNEVISISLKDGKIHQKFSTPGGAGTPFILNKTLYTASSKRLLYGFSL